MIKAKRCFSVCLAGFGCLWLAACATTPERERPPLRLPYLFEIRTVADARSGAQVGAQVGIIDDYLLNRHLIATQMRAHLNRTPWQPTPAVLDIGVLDYRAKKEGMRYILTMYLELRAFHAAHNSKNAPVGGGRFSCMAIGSQSFDLSGMVESLYTEREFVMADRDQKIWERLYEKCLYDVTYSFAGKLSDEPGRLDYSPPPVITPAPAAPDPAPVMVPANEDFPAQPVPPGDASVTITVPAEDLGLHTPLSPVELETVEEPQRMMEGN